MGMALLIEAAFAGAGPKGQPPQQRLCAHALRYYDRAMAFRTGFHSVFTGVGGPCLIEEGLLTLLEMLRVYGYATALFGKWHLGMTFHDTEGNPINNGSLESVRCIDYSRAVPTACCIAGSTGFSARSPLRLPISFTPIWTATASRFHRPGCWTKRKAQGEAAQRWADAWG